MNIVFFVLAYLVFMIPTYFVRYVGFFAAATLGIPENIVAMGDTVSTTLVILYWRGRTVGKGYIARFPLIGGVFDVLLPPIVFIPTVMTSSRWRWLCREGQNE